MSKSIFAILAIFISTSADCTTGDDSFFIDPVVGLGYNDVQGSVFHLGLDFGFRLEENLYAGLGAYFASGSNPSHDREIGTGPFISLGYPIFSWVSATLRQEVNFMQVYIPKLVGTPAQYDDHTVESGVAASTAVGLNIYVTRNIAISGGFRVVVGISNSELANGRSGPFLGLGIGF